MTNSMKSILLPAGTKRLAFIESTGTQYIDTLVTPDQDLGFSIDVYSEMPVTTDSQRSGAFFGTREEPHSSSQKCFWASSYGSAQCCCGYTTSRFLNEYTPGMRQQCSYTPWTFTSFKGTVSSQQPTSWSISKNVLLFCTRTADAHALPAEFAKMKLYLFTLTRNGSLVRDFIPVMNKGIACLYDTVSKSFFYNSGSGDFIGGAS